MDEKVELERIKAALEAILTQMIEMDCASREPTKPGELRFKIIDLGEPIPARREIQNRELLERPAGRPASMQSPYLAHGSSSCCATTRRWSPSARKLLLAARNPAIASRSSSGHGTGSGAGTWGCHTRRAAKRQRDA